MTKLVYICSYDPDRMPFGKHQIRSLSRHLSPDNISVNSPLILERRGVLAGVINPNPCLLAENTSVCMGQLFGDYDRWWEPGSEVPDGSYALFRGNEDGVEICSDPAGSRTIWYVHSGELFIASTSQRAIVCLLQEFQPETAVYSWMLSSGSLGPGLSWDKRIKCLPPDSSVLLDRRTWRISLSQNTIEYHQSGGTTKEYETLLTNAIEGTFQYLVANENWVLPLSGGVDSRGILVHLKDKAGLTSVTWGTKSAVDDKLSDAWIAKEVADHFSIPHTYFELDSKSAPAHELLERFLCAGEGRTDKVSGYADGFATWKWLFEQGCHGVIRGDEAMGCHRVHRQLDVYRNQGLTLLSHYHNLGFIDELLGEEPQRIPLQFNRQKHESLSAWSDRLNSAYEIPTVFSALSDLKLSYVELVNPLLSRKILNVVRRLPDKMRKNKRLFTEIVNRKSPNIPYAKRSATASVNNVLSAPETLELLIDYLRGKQAEAVLPGSLLRALVEFCILPPPAERSQLLRKFGFHSKEPFRSPGILAFRAYVICRMNEILSNDARLLGSTTSLDSIPERESTCGE